MRSRQVSCEDVADGRTGRGHARSPYGPPAPGRADTARAGHALHAADDGGAHAAGAQGAWVNMAAFMPGPHILLTIVRPRDIGSTAPRARSAGGRRRRLPINSFFQVWSGCPKPSAASSRCDTAMGSRAPQPGWHALDARPATANACPPPGPACAPSPLGSCTNSGL
jgi:hypothetical protein